MRSIHLGLYALFTSAILMVSCAEDELIENNHHLTSSETINFDAIVEWPKDYMDSRSATSSLKRVESPKLRAEEGNETLPMGVYVQDGIYPTSMPNPESRGAVITQDQLASFNVWATLNKAENVGGGAIEYFSNVEYTKGNEGVFSSSGKVYYWPGEGPTIDFVAVGNAPESGFTAKMANNVVTSFEYTVDQDATKQNDIVLAKAPNIAGNNDESVPLDFKHILSAVNVKVGSQMTAGTINSITFKNIKSKGNYDVDNGTWGSVDEPKDYTITFANGSSNYTTDGKAEGTLINGDNATLMMIPQTLANISDTEKVEIIVNFSYASGQTKDLIASLDGQAWAMGKTTNYFINISPNFTLTIEEDKQEPLTTADCHYDKRIIHIKNQYNDVDWTLTSNVDWVKFRIVPDNFRDDPSYAEFNDYWIETHTVRTIKKHVTKTGSDIKPDIKEDLISDITNNYSIEGTVNGKGSATVIVYFYENTETAPEGITKRNANLILNTKNETLEDITLPISQFYPLWASYNGGSIAYERIEENNNTYPWGLATSRKIEFSSPDTKPSWANSGWGPVIWWFIENLRFLQDLEDYFREAGKQARGELYYTFYNTYYNTTTNNSTQFITITSDDSSDPNGDGTVDWGKKWAWKATLNYNNLNDITTNSTGLDNTLEIINYASGSITESPAETWLDEKGFTSKVIVNDTDFTDIEETAAYKTSRLKNPLNLNTQITITTATNNGVEEEPITEVETLPSITSEHGIRWFLPANEEISTLKQTACDNDTENNDQALSGSYWTSTSGAGVNNTPSAFMYNADATSGTDVSRKSSETHKIRAARKK